MLDSELRAFLAHLCLPSLCSASDSLSSATGFLNASCKGSEAVAAAAAVGEAALRLWSFSIFCFSLLRNTHTAPLKNSARKVVWGFGRGRGQRGRGLLGDLLPELPVLCLLGVGQSLRGSDGVVLLLGACGRFGLGRLEETDRRTDG